MRLTPRKSTTTAIPKPLTSHNLRSGLVYALEPVMHSRIPCMLPIGGIEHSSMSLSTSPYSLGLQPYLGHSTRMSIYQHQHPLLQSSSTSVSAATCAAAATLMNHSNNHNHLLFAASLAPSAASISLLKLLLVFTAGGLFFSTAIAVMTACYAMGMDNIRYMWQLFSVVFQRVWITFTLGLSATKLALLGDSSSSSSSSQALSEVDKKQSWQWKSAWAVLKEQLLETRRTAAEGVQALRQEAKLYAAVVGPPGLIPLQYVVDRLMPLSLSTILEESIRTSLSEFPSSKTIKKIVLSGFQAGNQSPVLQGARIYDVENCLAFDLDVKWDSQLEAAVQLYTAGGLARVPVVLKNMKFEGVVRIIMTPLTKSYPGYGAILVSLAKPPKINLDVRVMGGEVTRLPFLRTEMISIVQKAISDQLLWPRRSVFPSEGSNSKPLLSPIELEALESTDPLLVAERALAEQPMLKAVHEPKEPDPEERHKMFRLSFLSKDDDNDNNNDHEEVDSAEEAPIQKHAQKQDTIRLQALDETIIRNSSIFEHAAFPLNKRHHDYSKAQNGLLWSLIQS